MAPTSFITSKEGSVIVADYFGDAGMPTLASPERRGICFLTL
jgi:hypothetical protein